MVPVFLTVIRYLTVSVTRNSRFDGAPVFGSTVGVRTHSSASGSQTSLVTLSPGIGS